MDVDIAVIGNDGETGSGAGIVYTTAYASGRGRVVHETTNGTITLCGRPADREGWRRVRLVQGAADEGPRVAEQAQRAAWPEQGRRGRDRCPTLAAGGQGRRDGEARRGSC